MLNVLINKISNSYIIFFIIIHYSCNNKKVIRLSTNEIINSYVYLLDNYERIRYKRGDVYRNPDLIYSLSINSDSNNVQFYRYNEDINFNDSSNNFLKSEFLKHLKVLDSLRIIEIQYNKFYSYAMFKINDVDKSVFMSNLNLVDKCRTLLITNSDLKRIYYGDGAPCYLVREHYGFKFYTCRY